MLNGWIILDKPVGLGSTTAVSAVKRILRQAGEPKTKVGHGGTLDPLASGVLPIALGEATKLCGRMLDATKAYDFTIRFGEETDTLDAEGEIVTRSDVRPTSEQIEAALPRFSGKIEQIPPAYSALKIEGKAAYARARAGEKIELRPRPSQSSNSALIESSADCATLSATVSKGTYIRSLARDIARALGTVGHVSYLRRTRAGPFGLGSGRFHWTFWRKPLRRAQLTRTVLPLTRRWTTSRPSPSPPTKPSCSDRDRSLPGSPQSRGFNLRHRRELRSLWSKQRPTASGSSGGSTFRRTGVKRCRLPQSARKR